MVTALPGDQHPMKSYVPGFLPQVTWLQIHWVAGWCGVGAGGHVSADVCVLMEVSLP